MRLLRSLSIAAILSTGLASVLAAASVHVVQNGFTPGPDGVPNGWRTWAPRPEIAPRTFVDSIHYRTRPGALTITGNGNAAEHGGWEYDVAGIEPGALVPFHGLLPLHGHTARVAPDPAARRLEVQCQQARRTRRLSLPDHARGRLEQSDGGCSSAGEGVCRHAAVVPVQCAARHGVVGRRLLRAGAAAIAADGHHRIAQPASAEHQNAGRERATVRREVSSMRSRARWT